jgi:dihydrolipoamide dehydrogenase
MNWKEINSMESSTKQFDLIIIGSGPAGYLSAILAARNGLSIAIIEKSELGGTCLNRGCIPTKTLLHEASLWSNFGKSGLIRKRGETASYFKYTLEKKNAAVNQVVSGIRKLLDRDPITLIQGEASFITPRTLSIKRDGKIIKKLESDRILIASGAVPTEVPPFKKDGQWIIGSDEALNMTELPNSLAIVGGGKRGVEFSTFFNTFEVPVTLIERENRILPKMDREISIRYRGLLTKRGVKVFTDAQIVAADLFEKKNSATLHILHKGKEEKLEFQKVLVVGDRRGNTDGLDIEKASLTFKNGFLSVDSRMKTNSPGIYAAGDIVGNGFFAHKAFLEAKIAVKNLLGKESKMDYRFIPTCLYSYPEAASIGFTEEEAKEKWGEIKIGRFPFIGCGRAVTTSEQDGMVKIISETKYGEILGVHILGSGATELIHLGAMAIKHEIGVEEIKEMIFAHPTFSEAFFEAALDVSDEAIHIMKG